MADRRTYQAVLWNLLIIGEAVKRLPTELRSVHPAIEWRKIAGLRDIIAHAYFALDDDILWDVVTTKLPSLLREADRMLHSHSDHNAKS